MEAIANARASGAAIFAVIDRRPNIDSLSTEGTQPELVGDLELKDVFFKYPARDDVQVNIYFIEAEKDVRCVR